GEWDRNRRRRSGERLERRRAGNAVRLQRRPVLEAAQRRVDVPTEDPVEGAGREAVLGEPELQRRDVPALLPISSLRVPSRWRAKRPSALRVCGPATPSTVMW